MNSSDSGPVVTAHAEAPTKTISAGGTNCAYRELGPKGGIPVLFFVHLAANLDNCDPPIVDPIAKMVPSVLSHELHARIPGGELIIHPGSGHGGIFQYGEKFAPVAATFLAEG